MGASKALTLLVANSLYGLPFVRLGVDAQPKGAFSWLAGHVGLSPASAEVTQEEKREGAGL